MPPVPQPIVGIAACLRTINERALHGVSERYVQAVIEACGCVPLLVPAIGTRGNALGLLDRLDGLLLPGSPSNVEPQHYGGAESASGTLHDPARDATTLPLIREAVRRDLPVLAICRGIQELNVALGGSLHQRIHEIPGRLDHRSRKEATTEERYGPAHRVSLAAGGVLRALAGAAEVWVNSVHSQGIDRPAPGLSVEAVAGDGQIEAVSLTDARFVVGVQWHPEYKPRENAFSHALLAAFGEACRGAHSRILGASRAA
jgi:putative glutamine amidotransferase